MSLKIGDKIPVFTLKDQNGRDFNSIDFIGHSSFVIFFYPKDFTPGCIKEVCSFRDAYQDFKDLGSEVIGISSDSEKMHKKFAQSYNLPFILLSDSRNVVRNLFGVKNNFLGLLPGRETYVFNKEGFVEFIFNSMKSTLHIEKALSIIKSINK